MHPGVAGSHCQQDSQEAESLREVWPQQGGCGGCDGSVSGRIGRALGWRIIEQPYVRIDSRRSETGEKPLDRKSPRLTPVTNAHLVCRLLLEKKKQTTRLIKY